MLKPNSAYDAIKDRLDQALASPDGITVTFPSRDDAIAFRMTAYALRRKDALASLKLYEPGNASYGCSPYDELVIRFATETTLHIALRQPVPPANPTPTPDQA